MSTSTCGRRGVRLGETCGLRRGEHVRTDVGSAVKGFEGQPSGRHGGGRQSGRQDPATERGRAKGNETKFRRGGGGTDTTKGEKSPKVSIA